SIGGGVARLVARGKIAHVVAQPPDLDDLAAHFGVKGRLEGGDAAAIGLVARGLAGGIGIGKVFGNDAHAGGLRMQAGGGDLEGRTEIHDALSYADLPRAVRMILIDFW